jgi:hypothetical protein
VYEPAALQEVELGQVTASNRLSVAAAGTKGLESTQLVPFHCSANTLALFAGNPDATLLPTAMHMFVLDGTQSTESSRLSPAPAGLGEGTVLHKGVRKT